MSLRIKVKVPSMLCSRGLRWSIQHTLYLSELSSHWLPYSFCSCHTDLLAILPNTNIFPPRVLCPFCSSCLDCYHPLVTDIFHLVRACVQMSWKACLHLPCWQLQHSPPSIPFLSSMFYFSLYHYKIHSVFHLFIFLLVFVYLLP